jgi:hypothetical protein
MVEGRLAAAMKDAELPPVVYGGLKREELHRTGSVLLHEHYFGNLGATVAPADELRATWPPRSGRTRRGKRNSNAPPSRLREAPAGASFRTTSIQGPCITTGPGVTCTAPSPACRFSSSTCTSIPSTWTTAPPR